MEYQIPNTEYQIRNTGTQTQNNVWVIKKKFRSCVYVTAMKIIGKFIVVLPILSFWMTVTVINAFSLLQSCHNHCHHHHKLIDSITATSTTTTTFLYFYSCHHHHHNLFWFSNSSFYVCYHYYYYYYYYLYTEPNQLYKKGWAREGERERERESGRSFDCAKRGINCLIVQGVIKRKMFPRFVQIISYRNHKGLSQTYGLNQVSQMIRHFSYPDLRTNDDVSNFL